uniref:Uncharacterized protein n=1 Tax=Strigamia maritima TaxID=126957 RepID=T1JCL0_STRMM
MNLLAGILFFVLVKSGLSLKCYQCSNLINDKSCEGDVKECTTTDINPFCMKTDAQTSDRQIILKGCGGFALRKPKNECGKPTDIAGLKATMCICTSDLCNSGNIKESTKFLMLFLIFMSILIQYMFETN